MVKQAPHSLQTVDDYIAGFPGEIQAILEQIRSIIRETVPDAEEVISYQMPTYRLHGNLIHFAVFKHHIGFYPAPTGVEAFQDEGNEIGLFIRRDVQHIYW